MAEMPIDELIREANELLRQDKRAELKALLENVHPSDIAVLVDHLDENDKVKPLLLLDDEAAANVLLSVDAHSLDSVLLALSREELSRLIARLEPDEATDVIAELPVDEQKEVISLLPKEDAKQVSQLLPYGPDTAGGRMNTNFIAISRDASVGEAIRTMENVLARPSASDVVYVTDEKSRLVGVVSLRTLLLSNKEECIEEIMNKKIISVSVHDDQEDVAQAVSKYDLVAVPVVDELLRLRGIVTVDDVMDVMEEEATEDMMRMAGTAASEPLFASPSRAAIKRLPWLYFNLGTAFIAASVVGLFRESISAVVGLAVFMPMVAAMGGNAGNQTLAVVVRALALGEVTLADVRRVLVKQMLVGVLTGLGIGIISSAVAYVWNGNFFFGILVGVSLTINLFMACVVGALIPLMLKRLKVDPALASSVFLTTLTDSIGFLVFLGLATLFLTKLRG